MASKWLVDLGCFSWPPNGPIRSRQRGGLAVLQRADGEGDVAHRFRHLAPRRRSQDVARVESDGKMLDFHGTK